MKTILILNGPPGVGKDTIGLQLAQSLPRWLGRSASLHSFKEQLIRIAQATAGLTEDEWARMYTRAYKERPNKRLGGLSPRQFLQRISEEWVKPLFGEDAFGNMAAADVAYRGKEICVFTDGGFLAEAVPLLGDGARVIMVRLHRGDMDFTGDTRSYVSALEAGMEGIEVLDSYLQEDDPMHTVHHIMGFLDNKHRARINSARG